MKAKFKKYITGGTIQAGLGAAQTIYGLSQLPRARAEFERAQSAAPSLDTPSQYYQNFKNAYDGEMARIQSDSIQSNLATSVQALQGAGGRALVGGLGAATAQSMKAQNQMLAQERSMRLQAGSQLAQAEERTIGRKEGRSQRDISMANQGYQAALGNVGAGLGAVGTGAMYGLKDTNLRDLINIDGNKAAIDPETNAQFEPLNLSRKDGRTTSQLPDPTSFVKDRTAEAAIGLEKAETDFLIENEKRRRAAAGESSTLINPFVGPPQSAYQNA